MIFNAQLDTSHHGPPHPLKVTWVFANSLTNTQIAMVWCLIVVNRNCKSKGIYTYAKEEIRGVNSDESEGHTAVSPLHTNRP
jgi:hypothetical protein